ncbi:MAG: PDZ domain-containing protein [Gemmatimonadaceae bacterium]|nr:PDZ domain-containing protein [Gemmatimonadaceae bacterium]
MSPRRPPRRRAAALVLAAVAAFASPSAGLRAQVAAPRPAAAPARRAAPAAPAGVTYDIYFPNAVHREAEVTARFAGVPAGPLRIRMARSSPGRYALHEFAKNIYAVRATTPDGRPLAITRASPHEWTVSGHEGAVVFAYTLYADRADGTYAGVDETRAHLNIPATFAYAPALAARPITVTFHRPDPAWRIATQLQPTPDPETFRAPNLQYFMDSPTHLGLLDVREWSVTTGGRTQTVRFALDHTGTPEQAASFVELVKRVVNEQAAIFGELPAFDFGTYTFVACYRPNCAGDGMEHRNSTSVTSSAALASNAMGLLGTVSHEFFHAWNVERIRPKALEPFDFAEANMSGELWLAEGFTNYYGVLAIARAGIIAPGEYARRLTGAVNTMTTSPARRFRGAVGMSQEAPFVDAAVSIDPNNRTNTFISYYTYGEALGLALDLMLRSRTTPVTLDDFMREMWARHGRAQTATLAPARPYTLADAEAALAAVTRDTAFARDFFARHVVGSALPDYPALLERAGFLVRPSQAGRAWMGDTRLSAFEGEVVVAGPTTIGTPLYTAGLAAGDRITRIGDQAVTTVEDVRRAVGARKPGDTVRLTWVGRGGERSADVALVEDPNVEVVAFEDAGRTVTPAQRAFRESWLRSRQR